MTVKSARMRMILYITLWSWSVREPILCKLFLRCQEIPVDLRDKQPSEWPFSPAKWPRLQYNQGTIDLAPGVLLVDGLSYNPML
jgi:hypothetical protein